jgi:hypothetical protein
MRKILVASTAAALLLVTPGLVPAAHADHDAWFVGTAFNIGPVHLRIVARNPDYGPPGYYYRSREPLAYRGYHCTSRCFKGTRSYYHDPYCPVVLHHFDRHHFNPYWAFDRYAPPFPGYYFDFRGHGGYGQRHDRYGHYRDRDRGYRHRGQYRHRSHPRSYPYRYDDDRYDDDRH